MCAGFTGNYQEFISERMKEKKKPAGFQAILKISRLKLLTGLTDTTSTSLVPQLPSEMSAPSSHFTRSCSGFHYFTSAPRAVFNLCFMAHCSPAHLSSTLLSFCHLQTTSREYKKHLKDTRKCSFCPRGHGSRSKRGG